MAATAKPRGPLGLLLAAAKPDDVPWDIVARRAGTSKSTVEGWLRGEREPKLRHALRLASVLEIPVADLAVAALAASPEEVQAAIDAAQRRAAAQVEAGRNAQREPNGTGTG